MIIILSLKQRKNMTVLILQKGKITSITIEMLLFRFSHNLTICKCICRSHGKSAYLFYFTQSGKKKTVHLFIAWSERIMITYYMYLVNNDTFMLALKSYHWFTGCHFCLTTYYWIVEMFLLKYFLVFYLIKLLKLSFKQFCYHLKQRFL